MQLYRQSKKTVSICDRKIVVLERVLQNTLAKPDFTHRVSFYYFDEEGGLLGPRLFVGVEHYTLPNYLRDSDDYFFILID
ncbi:hypothetical protein A2382_03780 [Candidatus Woesebacteria bacterium RIFOXYB1_FULL_38_16]|uniref:Uncharacterized protein n=1 Tax=Candidatus Woesebacteria bacterium RIFOXYB1_FULL_38_16 TaxID=1802538 RepID=A0A1F8CR46_9BACT|nr:MAG: hypothetical protein A2191_02270 [Candidatus Woesebacteria bacterium RIFOXYA1_FULL_38_9]OGM78770.1 MAG: hypothetical protein A2382_03780 [Candidatus Woesebacteria bacterium RIFOXYB1_FULL_38_16]